MCLWTCTWEFLFYLFIKRLDLKVNKVSRLWKWIFHLKISPKKIAQNVTANKLNTKNINKSESFFHHATPKNRIPNKPAYIKTHHPAPVTKNRKKYQTQITTINNLITDDPSLLNNVREHQLVSDNGRGFRFDFYRSWC